MTKRIEEPYNQDDHLAKICDEILYYYQEISSINGTISCSHIYTGHAYEILYTFPVSSNFICDVESVIKATLSPVEKHIVKNDNEGNLLIKSIKVKLALAFLDAKIYPLKQYVSNFVNT